MWSDVRRAEARPAYQKDRKRKQERRREVGCHLKIMNEGQQMHHASQAFGYGWSLLYVRPCFGTYSGYRYRPNVAVPSRTVEAALSSVALSPSQMNKITARRLLEKDLGKGVEKTGNIWELNRSEGGSLCRPVTCSMSILR